MMGKEARAKASAAQHPAKASASRLVAKSAAALAAATALSLILAGCANGVTPEATPSVSSPTTATESESPAAESNFELLQSAIRATEYPGYLMEYEVAGDLIGYYGVLPSRDPLGKSLQGFNLKASFFPQEEEGKWEFAVFSEESQEDPLVLLERLAEEVIEIRLEGNVFSYFDGEYNYEVTLDDFGRITRASISSDTESVNLRFDFGGAMKTKFGTEFIIDIFATLRDSGAERTITGTTEDDFKTYTLG